MSLSQEELLTIFEKTEALLTGHFILTSGLHSPNYFQCAKVLQYPNYTTLLCSEIADYFSNDDVHVVIAPAIGGIVVACEVGRILDVRTIFTEREEGVMKLRRGFKILEGENVLVVEDVITTGGSVMEVVRLAQESGGNVTGVGAIVDRSGGKINFPVLGFSLLKMNVITYQPEECPLCKKGAPIEKPGSRKV
jgi:orotate phosphoribosyltransferase